MEPEIVLILGLGSFVATLVGIEHVAPGAARLGQLSALAFVAVPAACCLLAHPYYLATFIQADHWTAGQTVFSTSNVHP